jgi:hypothetical protein
VTTANTEHSALSTQQLLATAISAIVSAYACGAVAQFGTPIDAALPVIAVIVTIIAAMTLPAIQLAVPLLIGGEIATADERLRLLWFGVVIGIAFAAALLAELDFIRASVLTVAAIIILRWIPLSNVMIVRELILIAIALLIVFVMRSTPIGVAIAVGVAMFTPVIPLRTFIFPIGMLIVLAALRGVVPSSRRPADLLASFALAVMLLFFPWSGVFARAVPLAIRGLPLATPRAPMHMALAPGQSIAIEVPSNATALILSGANVSQLREGTVIGSLNRVPLRLGDIADWGFLRREQFYQSRNSVPLNAACEVRGYGQSAWVDGAARFPIPRNTSTLRVTADPHLPPSARLQIDAFELVTR